MSRMEWFQVPKEEPSVTFEVGTILEDTKGVYKVLSGPVKQKVAHLYKVEVLQQKEPIPDELKIFIDPKIQTLVILAQNLDKIKRIS